MSKCTKLVVPKPYGYLQPSKQYFHESCFWSISNINNKLSDVEEAKCFCGLALCNGNWPMSKNEESQAQTCL